MMITKYMSKDDKRALLILMIFLIPLVAGIIISKYRRYHARMHSVATWGHVVTNRTKCGNHYSSEIEYTVHDSLTYTHFSSPMSSMRQGDSVIIYYDTTCYKRAFVPSMNEIDIETAFFLSEKQIIPMRWEKNYRQYKSRLELERKAHRERKHWYDRLCKDD